MKNNVQEKIKVVRKILNGEKAEPKLVIDKKVQNFMDKHDLSTEEMAALAGVSKTAVLMTEKETHSNMHITNAYKFMRAMGEEDLVDFAFEFGEEEEEEETEEVKKETKSVAQKERRDNAKKKLTVPIPGDVDNLTKTELEALAYFKQLTDELGRSPTLSELSRAMGYKSENGSHSLVRSLHHGGYLEKDNDSYQRKYRLTNLAKDTLKS